MNKSPSLVKDALISLAAGLGIGILVAAFSAPPFAQAVFGGIVLASLCSFALIRVWRGMGGGKSLAAVVLTTFLIRIAFGIFFYAVLPAAGDDTPVQNAGYVYSDAFERDTAAIELVQSGESLLAPFLKQIKSDQYGGLLTVSAAIYAVLSPQAARPLLITLLAAFTTAAGLAFFWSALRKRFSERFTLIAAWTLALYPEGVLLGSSQMREPFLIGLGCIAFWAALEWRTDKLKAFLVFLASAIGMVLFSAPAGLVIGGICVALVILEFTLTTETTVNRWTGIEVLILMGFGSIIAGWMWLQPTLYFSAYQAKMGSGMLQVLFDIIPDQWTIPFVTAYGLVQPVLPAAITDPAKPFWVVLGIIRAAGWWFMLPFLLYAFFSLMRRKKDENGWILTFAAIVFFVWTVVSSARAGGDQWDNPRYRAILLPWMAMVFAWVWLRVKEIHPAWFWRWVAIIGVFFLGVLDWYMFRKWEVGIYIHPVRLAAVLGGLSILILIGGAVWDRVRRPRQIGETREPPHG